MCEREVGCIDMAAEERGYDIPWEIGLMRPWREKERTRSQMRFESSCEGKGAVDDPEQLTFTLERIFVEEGRPEDTFVSTGHEESESLQPVLLPIQPPRCGHLRAPADAFGHTPYFARVFENPFADKIFTLRENSFF